MSEQAEAKPFEPRAGVTLVTNENVDDYVAKELAGDQTPEQIAAAELAVVEKEQEAKAEDEKATAKEAAGEDIDHPDEGKKSKLQERFSELTGKRKAAEELAEKNAAIAKENAERAVKAEQEAAELRAKYEKPVTQDLGPEPQPEQFGDVAEYSKAIKDWTAEKTRHDDRIAVEAQRQEQEQKRIAKSWEDRQKAAKERIPDYEAKLTASPVKVSNELSAAIVESEFGPEILVHLADNPDVAQKLGELSVRKMLVEFGKLETKIGGAEKPQTKSAEKTATVAEISRAPAPITPIRSAGSPVATVMHGHDEFHGTYEEYKAKRIAGKIK